MNNRAVCLTPLSDLEYQELCARIEQTGDGRRLVDECNRLRAEERSHLQEMQSLTEEVAQTQRDQWIIAVAVLKWADVLLKSAKKSRLADLTEIDLLNSGLFRRLLMGKRPLPFPPPLKHGVPWYEAIEAEEINELIDLGIVPDHVAPKPDLSDGIQRLVINGCYWDVLSVVDPEDEFLVIYQAKGPVFRLRRERQGWRLVRTAPEIVADVVRSGGSYYDITFPDASSLQGENLHLFAHNQEELRLEILYWLARTHQHLYGKVGLNFIEQPTD